MRCNWRRWLWGLIPLIAVSWVAILVERGRIERDLAQRVKQVLADQDFAWANIAFTGRDASLSGRAMWDSQPTKAEEAVRKVWGVRDVDNNAALPPKVEPFQWSARRRGNRVRLFGYVPNRATRQTIIGMTNAALPGLDVVDRMSTARGVPHVDTWLAGLSFALKQLALLKRGDVRVEDLAMTISGEAEDADAFRALNTALKAGLPKGITLASSQITAPVASPFVWAVQSAGGQVILLGHVAGEAARAELLAAANAGPGGATVIDRMELAEGAPADWSVAALAVVKDLTQLQSGEAEIKDSVVMVSGIAADEASAQAVRTGLRTAIPAAFKLTHQITVREPPPPPPLPPPPKAEAPALDPAAQPPTGSGAASLPQPQSAPRLPEPKASPPEAKPDPVPKAVVVPVPPLGIHPVPLARDLAPGAPAPAAAAPAASAVARASKADKAPAAAAGPAAGPPATGQSLENACGRHLAKVDTQGHILFDTDSAALDPASRGLLDRLAAAAQSCNGLRIAIEGHTDAAGSAQHNKRLSVMRARAVQAYLLKAGMNASQLEAIGYGFSRPAAPNDTAENMAKNRRIEFVVRRQ